MWLTTVLFYVLVSYNLVLGAEIYDVTSIYEVGVGNHNSEISSSSRIEACSTGVNGHIHSRTNALGLGLFDQDSNYIEQTNKELLNITCDIINLSDFNQQRCGSWEFEDETKWNLFSTGSIIKDGVAYKMLTNQTLEFWNMNEESYLYFTDGPESLHHSNIYFVITFYRRHSGNSPSLFSECKYKSDNIHEPRYSGQWYFNLRDRGRSTNISISCKNYDTAIPFDYDHDYLTFSITDEIFRQRVNIFRGKEQEHIVKDWTLEIATVKHMKFFSMSRRDDMDHNSAALSLKAIDIDEMVSPVFTPQGNQMCLSVVFNSSSAGPHSVLEVYALDLLTNGENFLTGISGVKEGWNTRIFNVTFENLNPIKLRIKKVGYASVSIARIASCSLDGQEVSELPLPVSVCPKDRFNSLIDMEWTSSEGNRKSSLLYDANVHTSDPAEEIDSSSNECWNGGVATTAGCACPPGFSGSLCDIGCGRNRFGQDCEGLCSLHSQECKGLLMCTKFTSCRCAPGYTGDNCTQECPSGRYGNDCSQLCGHCSANSSCDVYTGECISCEQGYLAPHCKKVSVYYNSKPEVVSPSYNTILVSFDSNNYITEHKPPQLYQIQFREKGSEWRVHTSKTLLKSSEENYKDRSISERIDGLKSGTLYQVRVILIDDDFLIYDGDLVQAAEVRTKCDIPENYDYKLMATSYSTSITFSWRYVLENQNWCSMETFEVIWKNIWRWQKRYTNFTGNFTLNDLLPGANIKLRVRAKTVGGFAPYSKMILASTQKSGFPPVRNLQEESSQSTSSEISWDPPRGSGDKQLRYTISYKCVVRLACSPGCQNVSEGQLMQEGTSVTLSPLMPFTQYLVTVSVEGGQQSSIYVGTTKVVPTEVPTISEQRPVRTNTSVTVFWKEVPVCSGFLLGYNYQLTEASNDLKILVSGSTKDTNVSFYNLTASTQYVVKVFVLTVAGWNPSSFLAINIGTTATVPEAVRNLTVYKRGRGILGLRWAEPRAIYGHLKSFTVTYSLGQEVTSHTVEPTHCVIWPELYCHTIQGLRSNRRYNVTVSARNVEVLEDGEPTTVISITKESSPSVPVSLKLANSTSSSIVVQWSHPDLANGILRSFLVSVEETEKYDQETCCQNYPLVENSVKEESQTYDAEVSGLQPAATYYVSVSAKTVALGPSQSLVVFTRPPHLAFTIMPRVEASSKEVIWLPPEKLPEVNNSEIYSSLIRTHLLLAVIADNETGANTVPSESGIIDPKLDCLLQQMIGKSFYFITEYNQDDVVEVSGFPEETDSSWGHPPSSLPLEERYQLIAAQVLEYSGVYNVDLCYSQTFTLI